MFPGFKAMTTAQIYISSQGKQWGPYSLKQVDFLLDKGSFQSSDWAWAECVAEWVALADLLESLRQPEPMVQPEVVPSVEARLEAKRIHPLSLKNDTHGSWWKEGMVRKLMAAGAAGLVLLLVVGWGDPEADYNSLQRRDGIAFAPDSDDPFEGKAISHHPNGQQMYSAHFRKGVEEGQIVSWYANGQKQSEADMRDGKFHGVVTYWHDNGRMMGHYTYEHGHVLHRKDWDPDGNVYKRK